MAEGEIGSGGCRAAKWMSSSGICLLAAALSAPAFAQETGGAVTAPEQNVVPPEAEDAVTGTDIIVTAQKREQSVQSVPVAISVVTGESMQARGLTSLDAITATLPAIRITEGGSSNQLFVRGVGSGNNAALEQSVGRFVDGVYDGRAKTSLGSLLDIERIEVLKGPQTIYFGNNAIGGAFNITTRKPSFEFDGYARALYNPRMGGYAIEAAQSIPVSATLSFRVAGLASGENGWMYDTGSAAKVPSRKDWNARVSALWEPTADLSIHARVDLGHNFQEGSVPYKMINCPPGPEFTAGPGRFCREAIAQGQNTDLRDNVRSTTPGQYTELDTQEFLLNVDYDIGGPVLTSVSSYRYSKFDNLNDIDGVAAYGAAAFTPERYKQFGQELRITSPAGTAIEYIAGAYFQRSKLDADFIVKFSFLTPVISGNPAFASLVPLLPLGQGAMFEIQETTASGFGAVTWNLTDRLSFTGGLRWTSVEKDFEQHVRFGTAIMSGGLTPFPADLVPLADTVGRALRLGVKQDNQLSRKDEDWAPSARVQYEATPDVMLYATYSNGFKAGGFQGNNFRGDPAQLPFGPEQVDAYEVGVKSRLFDRDLTVNVAAFQADYSDLQVTFNQFVGSALQSFIANAASARSRGVELDLDWRLSSALKTNLQVTYLDSEYLDYTNAGGTALQLARGQQTQDLSGAPTSYAPEWSGNFNAQYLSPEFRGVQIRASGDVFYSSRYNVTPTNDPLLDQPSYVKLGATLALLDADGNWEISLIGRNLNDKTILTFATNVVSTPGSFLAAKEPPRSISLQGRINW
jgi:outer membrane receptor protein involved in Fe transport